MKRERAAYGEQKNRGKNARALFPHGQKKRAEYEIRESQNRERRLKNECNPRRNGSHRTRQIITAESSPPNRKRVREQNNPFTREQVQRHERQHEKHLAFHFSRNEKQTCQRQRQQNSRAEPKPLRLRECGQSIQRAVQDVERGGGAQFFVVRQPRQNNSEKRTADQNQKPPTVFFGRGSEQKIRERDVNDCNDKNRRANERENITDAENCSRHRAAEIRHEIHRLFAAKGFAYNQKRDDDTRDARDGRSERGKKSGIENGFKSASEYTFVV